MDSVRLYVAARVWWSIAWAMATTMSLVYMVQDAGLDPLQMVLIGTALELSVFLFEIPTGVVADLISRRLSVIIGHAGVGVGLFVMALVPEFWAILAANVFWGISYTFISGAYPAWLSGEVGKERAGKAFIRGSQLGHAGAFIGIGAAVALAHQAVWLPVAVGGGGIAALSLVLAFGMQEKNFEPSPHRTWQKFGSTLVEGVNHVRARPVLLLVLATTAVYGLFSEGIDRLFTPLVLENFSLPPLGPLDGVAWWGVIAAVAHVIGMAGLAVARRRVKVADARQLTRVTSWALVVVTVMTLALAASQALWLALACYWVIQGARSIYGPLLTAWLNQLLPEEGKATLFSIYGQADALGQVAGGPMIGAVARAWTISLGLAVSAVLLAPGSWLLRKAARALHAEQHQPTS